MANCVLRNQTSGIKKFVSSTNLQPPAKEGICTLVTVQASQCFITFPSMSLVSFVTGFFTVKSTGSTAMAARTDSSGTTLQTLIRLLLVEQSDLGLHCLLFSHSYLRSTTGSLPVFYHSSLL